MDSPKFKFYKIRPQKIYFSGGFGVMATWVNVPEYELARPDVLAQVRTHPHIWFILYIVFHSFISYVYV